MKHLLGPTWISHASDNEGGIEVAVDHQRSQGVVLTNLVLVCIDLPSQELVKVNLILGLC